jgi:mitochondrial fission protein ELM1
MQRDSHQISIGLLCCCKSAAYWAPMNRLFEPASASRQSPRRTWTCSPTHLTEPFGASVIEGGVFGEFVPRSTFARVISVRNPRVARLPRAWLLLGGRAGDNNQALALAEALGFPFEAKKLRYNNLRRLPRRRPGLRTLKPASRPQIGGPWPDLVICVGYASVPIARYIRDRSNGRSKLVHIGNPREKADDFDLQITTPQYPRQAPNLLELPFPIGNPAWNARPTAEELQWLDDFRHPRRLVVVGGPTRHWELDEKKLISAIRKLKRMQPGGSLLVVTSPRTPERTKRTLEKLLKGRHCALVDAFPSFGTLLARSQEIYVTADSVSMLSEAILSGRPVGLIPIRRSLLGKLSNWLWERPLGRSTIPDLRNFWRLLKERNLVGTVDLPVATQVCDTVEQAADAVRRLFVLGDVSEQGSAWTTDPHLGAARRAGGRQ